MIADRRIALDPVMRGICISPTKPKRPLPYSQFYLTAMIRSCKDASNKIRIKLKWVSERRRFAECCVW